MFTDGRSFIPVLTTLTTAHADLATTMDGAKKAFIENNRIQQDYQKRTQEVDFQLGQLRNNVVLAAASFGEKFAPQIKVVIGYIDNLLRWLGNLDPNTKQTIVNFFAFGAILGVVGGGLLTFTGQVLTLINGFRTLAQLGAAVEGIKGLQAAFEGATAAAEGTAAAETTVATEGAVAFGLGGPLAIAIVAITALVATLATAWWGVKSAQDEAAQGAQDLADRQKQVASTGLEGTLIVQRQNLAERRSDLQDRANRTLDPKPFEPYVNGTKKWDKEGHDLISSSWGKARPGEDLPRGLDGDVDWWSAATRLAEDRKLINEEIASIDKQDNDLKVRLTALSAKHPKKQLAKTDPDGVPWYLLGGGQPNASAEEGKKKEKGRKVPGSVYHPLHMERIDSLKPLLEGEIANARTDADTFGAKSQTIEDSAADQILAAKGNSQKEYQINQSKLNHLIELSNNAIQNITKDINPLVSEVQGAEKRYKTAAGNLSAYQDALKKQGDAGQKMTEAQDLHLKQLKGAYEGAKQQLDDSKRDYEKQYSALANAKGSRRRYTSELARLEDEHAKKERELQLANLKDALKTDGNRSAYDNSLKSILATITDEEAAKPFKAALAESEAFQKRAAEETAKEIARLSAKDGDFIAQRALVTSQADEKRKAKVPEDQVQAFIRASNSSIDSKEFESGWKKLDEHLKSSMADGDTTLGQYRDAVAASLDAAKTKFGENSDEADKLGLALKHIDWQIADENALHFREALDQGGISLGRYIAEMEHLRGSVSATSPEYRKLTEAIDGALKRQEEHRKSVADSYGTKVGDTLLAIFHKQSTVSKAFNEMITGAMDEGVKNFFKTNVSKFVMHLLGQKDVADKAKEAADLQNKAADKSLEAARMNVASAGREKSIFGAGDRHAGSAIAGNVAQIGSQIGEAVGKGASSAGGMLDGITDGVKSVADGVKSVGTTFGKNSGTTKSLASISSFASKATAVLGYVGAAYTIYDTVKGFFAQSKPDFTTRTADQHYSQVGSGDHSGFFTGGLSGVSGMRSIIDQKKSAASGNVVNLTLAAGAVTVHAAPHHDEITVARHVIRMISEGVMIDNSLRGNKLDGILYSAI